jgi:hypothetical protein
MEARAVRNKAVHGGEISKDAARPALDNINGLIAKITTHQFGK